MPTSSVKRALKLPRDEQPTAKHTSVTLWSSRNSSRHRTSGYRPRAPSGRVGRAHCCARPPSETGRARFHASGSSKPIGADRLVVVRHSAASLGPFTAEAASNLSSGSDSSSILSWGSPDPRQHPFGVQASACIRPVIRDRWRKGQPFAPWFPAAFRPPAFACRVILFPPGNWALLTVGLPGTTTGPDPDGVTTFRACEIRPGWVPPLPRGRRCSPWPDAVPGQRLPLPSGQSLHPAGTSHRRGSSLRGINGGLGCS